MGSARRFTQVDVFTAEPLLGNPVAVVHDGADLDTAQMQQFTAWTNLSEATFLGPPAAAAADYSVRIFTGSAELPFAGHPTLGSCHAWLAAGGEPRGELIVQECGVGLIDIRRDPLTEELFFRAPERQRSGPLDDGDVDAIAAGVGLGRSAVVDHQWCDNGPPWQTILLETADQVLGLRPDAAALAGRFVGVVGAHPPGGDVDFEVRAFFPAAQGLGEDPVTGSLNAAVGQWLIGSARAPQRYVAAQGTAIGRAGRVTVEQVGSDIWVGGRCVSVVEGTVTL